MSKSTSQKALVKTILRSGKTLTQKEARVKYKIGSLSSRVNELRKEGEKIVSNRVNVRDRNTGQTRSVVRYGKGSR
jgi:hypothetical protein